MIDYAFILATYYKDRVWTLNGEEYAGLNFLDNQPSISQEELDSKAEEHFRLNAYKEQRKKEYPPMEDLIVALMENAEGRPEMLEEVKLKRAKVKETYPKPE